MATTYNAELKVGLTPKEVTTLGDGLDTTTTIDSNIDKTIGGNIEFANIGGYNNTTPSEAWHSYKSYPLTSTTYINVLDIVAPSSMVNPTNILMVITSQEGTLGAFATVQITDSLSNTMEVGTVKGVGGFINMPLTTGNTVQIKTYTTKECTLDIFIWGVNP